MISNTNGRRKGKKRKNDQRCDMLARVKLEDEGISRHGRNTRYITNFIGPIYYLKKANKATRDQES